MGLTLVSRGSCMVVWGLSGREIGPDRVIVPGLRRNSIPKMRILASIVGAQAQAPTSSGAPMREMPAKRRPDPDFAGSGHSVWAAWTVSRILSVAEATCNHFSGTVVADRLKRATRSRTRGHGRRRRPPTGAACACTRWGLPCPPRHRGGGALLPHRFTLTTHARGRRSAVCFLLHCPACAPTRTGGR